MLTRIAALITAATLLLSAAPKAVLADTASSAPITVQDCHADGYRLTYDITFTNVASKAVSKVRFALVNASGALAMIDDAGSYAPGDVVRHRYRPDQLLLRIYSDTTCVPATVTFQDGTTWQSPAVGPDMEKSLQQTPGSHIAVSKCYIGDGVQMDWTNTAQQSATQVDVGLIQHGVMVFQAVDKGTFSPGTLIQREYDYDPTGRSGAKGYFVGDDMMQNRCIVLGVQYADGTAWTNPSAPPLSEKGIPFTVTDPDPNAPIAISNCDGSSGDNWRVSYGNKSSKPIVAADFALIMHGRIDAAARDLHDISPEDGNNARFPLDGDDKVFHPQCIPLRVNFADGTVWYNPLFAPASAAGLSQ
ncbi:MAG TPA: hypothetical protein VKT72_12105 [Candidatus Baltobacteraceae bacterium]|nr:hypothetical protein [Candidatus Baltobacteraceae bacterium]